MSHHPPPNPDPLVGAALDLLRAFHIDNRRDALMILAHWTHYDELTDAQVLLVLNAYPSRGRPDGESR